MEHSRSPHQSRLSSSVVAVVCHRRIRGQSRGKRYVAWCSSSVAHTRGPFNHSCPTSRGDGTSTGLGMNFFMEPSSLKWNKRGSRTRKLYQTSMSDIRSALKQAAARTREYLTAALHRRVTCAVIGVTVESARTCQSSRSSSRGRERELGLQKRRTN